MKRTKLWLPMIAVLLCSISVHAYDFQVDGIYYNIISSTNLTVGVTYHSRTYHAYRGTVTIPSTVTFKGETYNVTSIGQGAFAYCDNLTEIIIPEGVTSIGEGAFRDCSNLTNITTPESVTSIGDSSFGGCSSLTSIIIPKGVTSIGYNAFGGCSSLTSIIIPKGVTSIGYYAFRDCSSLTNITIPESVTSIGNSAFRNCSSLTNITIPDSVTIIRERTFSGCCNLTSITIPKSVIYIEDLAFSGCSKLGNISIPEGVMDISHSAFEGCSRLYIVVNYSNLSMQGVAPNAKIVVNGNNLVIIGDFWFETSDGTHDLVYYAGKESNLVLPNNFNGENYSIMGNAFFGCSNLQSLTIGSGVLSINKGYEQPRPAKTIWLTNTPPSGYTNVNGKINYVANDKYTSLSNVKIYPYLSSMFEVDGVKYVPVSPSERTCHAIDCAYNGTTIANIGETTSFKGMEMKVMEITPYAFYGNDEIKEVSVSHLGNMGDFAFYDCDSIQRIVLSNKGNIGDQAFYNCHAIKSANISNQGNIGSQAFYGCTRLETAIIANYPPTTPSALTFADWTSTNKTDNSTSYETYTFKAGEGATLSFHWLVSSEVDDKLTVTLDGTTILEKSGNYGGDFSYAISQGRHTLMVKYTKDSGYSSGADRAKVTDITVSKGYDFITVGSEAFSRCQSLQTVTLGDAIEVLADKAFYQCTNLQEVVIPNAVTSIGEHCFSGCSAMKNAVIGDHVAIIGNSAFNDCSLLSEIALPQSVTKIENYTFQGCTALTNVIIEDRDSTLSIGSNGSNPMFSDCPLDSVYIGGNISYNTSKSYGYSPFYRNTSLRTIVITGKEDEICDNEFYGCTNLKNVTIGDGVKKIGNWAFSGCSNLDYFAFGKNVESIGEEAFSDCVNVTQIISSAATPPTCGTQALDDINKWSCTLKVPMESLAAYQQADQWKDFFFMEGVETGINSIKPSNGKADVYNTDGRLIQRNADIKNLKKGLYIINGKKVMVR